MKCKTELEARLFNALKRITQYQSVESIKRYSEREYGLYSSEAIEMAYENVIHEAKVAIKGVHRPSLPKGQEDE